MPSAPRDPSAAAPAQKRDAGLFAFGARRILGMRVDASSYARAAQAILEMAETGGGTTCVATVHMVMEAHGDPAFQRIVNASELVTSDGMPLVWMLRAQGLREAERVYGPDLLPEVCAAAAARHVPVGLYGASPEVVEALAQGLAERFPGLRVAFAMSPPFRALTPEEDAQVVEAIRESGARILFVGLGCPKQERWMAEHRELLPCAMVGVGAAFDFLAGRKRQAPRALQRAGLEWLFRLASEPRRLWRRYAWHNPRFVAFAVAELWRDRRALGFDAGAVASWLLRHPAVRALGRLVLRVPPLRPALYTWRARRETAAFDASAPAKASVLVYQMGKVGSASVLRALEAAGVPAFHVHSLAPAELERAGVLHRRAYGRCGVGYAWYVGRALGERIRAADPARRFPVITLVRDPIAREVSGIFQSPELHGEGLVDARRRFDVERVLACLRARLCAEDGCDYVFGWFHRELRAVLGVDVLASPFPRERGYTVLEGARASVLVLRTEDLDRTLVPGLRELLGIEKRLAAARANVREQGPGGDAYREVQRRLRLPRDAALRIYAHPFVRHFYPDAMIEAFLSRWAEPLRA